MANDTQDEPSRNSIVGRSVISPPPPYTSIDLKNDKYHHHRQTVDDTVSKMQEVIENTYLMMQDLQNRLVRLERSNQLFATGPAPRIHNNSTSTIRDESHSADDHDYTDILDTMTHTVQQLLQEARASLDRTIVLPSTAAETPTNTPETTHSDQQSRYSASEQKLNRAFELLMDQVCSTNFSDHNETLVPAAHPHKMIKDSSSPIGQAVVLDYHYHHHHHHHHHHHYHDDYSPPSTPLPRSGTDDSVITTSTMPIDHLDYTSLSSPSTSDATNTMLTTATTKSVQLVQSWLSPLHRLTSLSPPANHNLTSPISAPPVSPSASTTTFASLSSVHDGKGYQQRHYCARLYRILWILLITGRLLLNQHYRSPSSFLHYNIHLLQPRHRHLWHKYNSSLLGSSSSWSALCRQLSRFIFIIQFIYHIIST